MQRGTVDVEMHSDEYEDVVQGSCDEPVTPGRSEYSIGQLDAGLVEAVREQLQQQYDIAGHPGGASQTAAAAAAAAAAGAAEPLIVAYRDGMRLPQTVWRSDWTHEGMRYDDWMRQALEGP
jgi:hypothetical protein